MDLKKAVKKVAKAAKSNCPLPSPAPFWLGFSQKVGGEGPPEGKGRGKSRILDEKTTPSYPFDSVFSRAPESSRTNSERDTTLLQEFCRAIGCPNAYADDDACRIACGGPNSDPDTNRTS